MNEAATPNERLEAIQTHLSAGKKVMVATAYRAWVFGPKHRDMFKTDGKSLYMQRGKSWDCIDYAAIRFSK